MLDAVREAQEVFGNYPAVTEVMSRGEAGFADTLVIMRVLADSGDTRKVRRAAARLAEALAAYLQ